VRRSPRCRSATFFGTNDEFQVVWPRFAALAVVSVVSRRLYATVAAGAGAETALRC